MKRRDRRRVRRFNKTMDAVVKYYRNPLLQADMREIFRKLTSHNFYKRGAA